MGTYSQATRQLQITTPLGKDVLLLERTVGEEGISTPFRFDVEMVSENASINAQDLLRKPATISVALADGSKRYINGWFSRFVQLGSKDGLTRYHGTLAPWYWFLSLWSDCKIFQTKSVPDIAEEVFSKLGFTDYKLGLIKPHLSRDYTVQYRESSFNFLSRLFEEEGIYYYFEHTDSKHILTLIDNPAKINYGLQRSFSMASAGAFSPEDSIQDIQYESRVTTDRVLLKDYNFTTPSASLKSQEQGTQKEELYDYPGRYDVQNLGDTFARVRLEELEAPQETITGEGSGRAMQSGYKFDLKNHYRRDLNQTYTILRVIHDMRNPSYQSTDTSFEYQNRFELIPYSTPYRPPRVTPRGRVLGSHTAVVVGPAGEEIYTDTYGRVKVQFFWDRLGKKNETSSCWVRVSQEWAGKNWGSIHIPRIGQEVIVEFLEGDPDRPIITGRVYNAEQMPPYDLPANMTQSGIKTRSSTGGGADNYNEIRFEDKKGSELLLIHAEKNKQVDVENDRTETVGNDESITIGHDRTEHVKNDENITIDHDRTELVKNDETITINGNRTETVMKDESITISQNRTETVGQAESITIGQKRDVTIGQQESVTIGQSQSVTVGQSISITAGMQITLTAGANVISMSPSGISMSSPAMITITGALVMIN
ncbi:MAG TPA: type VI secretion system tip protein TssI/VgrG [Bryobacteraceae bacterium]|jgi:type VI secretion system secreted protein VgrG|nr:type VI secretion system tip protein TssI/VgrG [Bryobacteraceae bacterium]